MASDSSEPDADAAPAAEPTAAADPGPGTANATSAIDPRTRKLLEQLRAQPIRAGNNTNKANAGAKAGASAASSAGGTTAAFPAAPPAASGDSSSTDAGGFNPRVTSLWVPGSILRPTPGAGSPTSFAAPAVAAPASSEPAAAASPQPAIDVPPQAGISTYPEPSAGDAAVSQPVPAASPPSPSVAAESPYGGASENVSAPLPVTVGQYQVATRIGQGGTGSTYVCRRLGAVGFQRLFTLKVIRQHSAQKDVAIRSFKREARIGELLSHPNISTVVDVGTFEGQLFLILDYIDGTSLADLLEDGHRAPPAVIVTILLDALRGLQRAHDLTGDDGRPLGLVHRDVSPENIMVGLDGIARVTDFGNARLTQAPDREDPEGALVGKAAYMAPEQLCAEPIDSRTDLFAIGAVMWTALTGEKLFAAESYDQTVMKVLRKRVPPPSTLGAPACLDEICLKALTRSKEGRYATADEMADALTKAAAANGLTASAREVGQWVQTRVGQEMAERRRRIELMFRMATGTPPVGVPTSNKDATNGRPDTRAVAPAASSSASPKRPPRNKGGKAVAPTIYLSARPAPGPGPGTPRREPSSAAATLPPWLRRRSVIAAAAVAWVLTLFLAYFVARGLRRAPSAGYESAAPPPTEGQPTPSPSSPPAPAARPSPSP